ncbi:MAG TPA: DUF3500 domain-containing protein [Chthoniobacteraceae bacterium]
MNLPLGTLFALLFCFCTAPLRAHDANAEMATAAAGFLASLTPEQKTQTTFEFSTDERKNWHFIPRPRKGITFKELNEEQRLLAHALLASGLSSHGYVKAVSIMSLDSVLAILEKDRRGAPARDPQHYCISVFGTPGTAPWGWRVEGHHLSLNFTAAEKNQTAVTPSFFGTNPAEVRSGPRMGTRILRAEEDLARELVKSLSDEQLKVALILPDAPKEIFNDPKRVEPTKPEGLPQNQLTAAQNELLVRLVKEYLFRCRHDVASVEWERIEKAGLDRLHFAWAGGLEAGQPHYYRVQGGNFVLEYDNTQNDSNHVHSLWRDFDHDFGNDLLKAHVDQAHAP